MTVDIPNGPYIGMTQPLLDGFQVHALRLKRKG